jgi:hypothetical protein
MEQGYHIAVANGVTLLGVASPDSVLIQAISSPSKDDDDTQIGGTSLDDTSSLSRALCASTTLLCQLCFSG